MKAIPLLALAISLLFSVSALADTLIVDVELDRASYTWFGDAVVTAAVSLGGFPVSDCGSVIASSSANPTVSATLADDGLAPDLVAGDGSYAGILRFGGELGEARPEGSYRVDVAAVRDDDTGEALSPLFALYRVRRWTGITTSWAPDSGDYYTAFQVQPNGGLWRHRILDLGLVRSSAMTDALIRIPILPLTNTISNLIVTGAGVSDVQVVGNVIQFVCDLSFASVTRIDIEFDAPSDLAATLIDRYRTADIGQRNFRNGYLVWNRYIHSGIMGSDFSYPHGPGCVVDLHVTDLTTGAPHTVDCMERVAVHLDNSAHNDGTGTYPSNIKWTGDALSWLVSADLEQLSFSMQSGGAYGLADKVAVTKTVQFFASSRRFRHEYIVRNIDGVSHDFDFVWGREQWLYGSDPGSDRQEDDRGLLPNDPGVYGGEYGYTAAALDGNWLAAYDLSSNYSIAVLFSGRSPSLMPDYSYFLCNPALGGGTGEYPINPAGACTSMENLFFEKQLGSLGPGELAAFEFYQWGGYGADRGELTDLLWRDATLISGEPLVLEGTPSGDDVPIGSSIVVQFSKTMDRSSSEAALALSPTAPPGGSWTWSAGDTRLRFQPGAPLLPDTEYECLVRRTATDTEGTALATAALWSFTTADDLTGVADSGSPLRLQLRGALSNPFIESTRIAFVTPTSADVRLTVYDVGGRRVRRLADSVHARGAHELTWDGRDGAGRPVAAGVYFIRLEAAGETRVRKVLRLR